MAAAQPQFSTSENEDGFELSLPPGQRVLQAGPYRGKRYQVAFDDDIEYARWAACACAHPNSPLHKFSEYAMGRIIAEGGSHALDFGPTPEMTYERALVVYPDLTEAFVDMLDQILAPCKRCYAIWASERLLN